MNELFFFLRARPKWFRRLKLRIGQDYDFMLKLPKETFVYICNKVIGYWKQKGTKELLKLYRVLAWMLTRTLCSVVEVISATRDSHC